MVEKQGKYDHLFFETYKYFTFMHRCYKQQCRLVTFNSIALNHGVKTCCFSSFSHYVVEKQGKCDHGFFKTYKYVTFMHRCYELHCKNVTFNAVVLKPGVKRCTFSRFSQNMVEKQAKCDHCLFETYKNVTFMNRFYE